MATNKLTTLGYFVKRLRDSGYVVDKLFINYGQADPRCWTVIIDPAVASVMCTCYVNDPMLGESYFEIHDGGQFIPNRHFKIKTNSIEVFVSYLVQFGINNKAESYPYARNPVKAQETAISTLIMS
jgi:hypothetical protein